MINIGLFKKPLKVWIDTNENLIFSKLAINGIIISKIQCILQNDGVFLIGDIMPFNKKRHYRKGYGCMMMDELLRHSRQNEIHTITGNLSLVDKDHKDRLHAFYKKHGFEVIVYDAPKELYYGEVIKKILY